MDWKSLDNFFEDALQEVKEQNAYRLNFGVYYTPRF